MESWSGSFDEFLSQLAAHIQGGGSNKNPRSNNPESYPRAIKVEDSDVLMLRSEMRMLEDRLSAAAHEAQLMVAKISMFKEQLFIKLKEVYPRIQRDEYGDTQSVGYRYWKGELWYVSWNVTETGQENSGGNEIVR